MPYIGNVLTSFAVETGNISDQAVTAPKLSATGGTDGQVLALDSNLNLEWVSDPAGQWVTNGSNIHYNDGNVGIGLASPSDLLEITPTSTREGLTIKTTGTTFGGINIDTNRTGAGHTLGDIRFMWNGTGVAGITGHTGSDTTNKDDGRLIFNTASAGSATERMRIDSAGNVMVGLTSGTGKLQVAGGIRVAGSASHSDTSSPYIYRTSGADNLCISTSSTERLRIDSSGNVGINKTPSTYQLEVNGGTANTVASFESSDATARILFKDDSGEAMVGATGDDLTFYTSTSATERLRINSSGNVGIGTTSPGCELEIGGNGHIHLADQGRVGCNSGSGAPNDAYIKFFDTDIVTIHTTDTERLRIDSSGQVGIGTSSPADKLHVVGDVRIQDTSPRLGFHDTNASTLGSVSGGFETFDSSGNRSIFVGSVDVGGHCLIGTNNTERLRVTTAGNVGIGTASPGDVLDVRSGAAGFSQFVHASGQGGVRIAGTGASSSANLVFSNNHNTGLSDEYTLQMDGSSDSLKFLRGGTGAAETMRLDSSGRVGIGDTSPANTLSVIGASTTGNGSSGNVAEFAGPSNTNGFQVFVSDTNNNSGIQTKNADDLIINPHGGNVGIGTTSPRGLLHLHSSSAPRLDFTNTTTGTGSGDGATFSVDGSTGALNIIQRESQPIQFYTSNTERMRINSSGNMLIGHSSAADSNNRLEVENTFGGRIGLLRDDTSVTSGNNIGQLSFYGNDSSGVFHTIGQIEVAADGTHSTGSKPTRMQFYTCPSSDNNNVERLRIDSAGGLFMGSFSDYGAANYGQTSGDGNLYYRNDDGSTGGSVIIATDSDNGWSNVYLNRFDWGTGDDSRYIHFFKNGASVSAIELNAAGTQIAYNTGSDYRLKENVVSVTNAISRLKQLHPKSFNYIADEDDNTIDGFLAHEASTVVPYAVTGTHNQTKVDEEGNTVPVMQGMDYGKLTPLLTAALQEAIAKIETLEAKVAALEAE